MQHIGLLSTTADRSTSSAVHIHPPPTTTCSYRFSLLPSFPSCTHDLIWRLGSIFLLPCPRDTTQSLSICRQTFVSLAAMSRATMSSSSFRLSSLSLLATLLLLLVVVPSCRALYQQSSVNSNDEDGLAFVARFCWDHDPSGGTVGNLRIDLHDPKWNTEGQIPLQLALYNDQDDSWPLALQHMNDYTCRQLLDIVGKADSKSGLGVIAPLTGSEYKSAEVDVVQKIRPRFWFIVVARCDPITGKGTPTGDIEYELHALNVQQSSWDHEFGTNERGLNTLYLTFCIVYLLFFIVHFVGVWKLRQQLQYVHPIVKLFSFILVVQVVSVVFYLVHYFKFGQNGVGLIWMSYMGAILDAVARIVFIFLLLLLAHGWTISNDHLQQRWIIAGVLGVFFVLQVAQFGYAWYSYNPELTAINKGDFVFQIMIVALYLLIGVYFVFMLVVSYVNEIIPPKKKLYLRLGILFAPWMLGPPLVAVGVLLLDDWVRQKIVLTLQTTLTFVAYAILSFLLWPSRAQEYFSISSKPTLADFHAAYDRL